ncbi:hypothetical protein [uncultured Prochlorococcus sp.]|uniref:hypothetical protein n=1 Tax=uncultured Prochlorococcus sp. TaxID=159733 RepID=UPI00258E9FDB|nr:hypothetical protein [uncultured Prochlorococcus sp.]
MLKLIIAGLIGFLLYTSDTFRTYTIEALKTITTFIQELPKENEEKKNQELENIEYKGFSTYEE